MCSESGKQVYITSIQVYVCFFILIVYLHVPECARREKSGKNGEKKRQEKVREFRFSQGSSKFGEKAGKYHFIHSYPFNGTDVTIHNIDKEFAECFECISSGHGSAILFPLK